MQQQPRRWPGFDKCVETKLRWDVYIRLGLGMVVFATYVYNINRDRVFMANKDQYKDRGAAEVFITGLYSP